MTLTENLNCIDLACELLNEAASEGIDLNTLPGEPELGEIERTPLQLLAATLWRYVHGMGRLPILAQAK